MPNGDLHSRFRPPATEEPYPKRAIGRRYRRSALGKVAADMPPTTAATTVVEPIGSPVPGVIPEPIAARPTPRQGEAPSPAVRALVDICEARYALDQRERELVSVARSEGASWGAIADALDESRATIFRRHRAPDTVA